MASTDPEISAEGAMPQWMKVKLNTSTNFDAPFAPQSPPAYEDSFFYIRYPNASSLLGSKQKEPNILKKELPSQNKEIEGASSLTVTDFKDWSKHTKPCKEVFSSYPNIKTTAAASITSKPKPAGIDDGFKGEGAACGSSIIKVAHQMISGQKISQRGYTEAAIDIPKVPEDGTSDDGRKDFGQYNVNARRGSKSLPASPSSSPTSRRKAKNMSGGNRYFAGTYEVPPDISSSRSWIMAALLGQKRDMAYSSTSTINEEEEDHRLAGNTTKSLAASVDYLGPKPTVQPKDDNILAANTPQEGSSMPSRTHKFRAKPTELREINFWSPTSM